MRKAWKNGMWGLALAAVLVCADSTFALVQPPAPVMWNARVPATGGEMDPIGGPDGGFLLMYGIRVLTNGQRTDAADYQDRNDFVGDESPFREFDGRDAAGAGGQPPASPASFNFELLFDPSELADPGNFNGGPLDSISLAGGLYDIDSFADGDQIQELHVSVGNPARLYDLTDELNGILEAMPVTTRTQQTFSEFFFNTKGGANPVINDGDDAGPVGLTAGDAIQDFMNDPDGIIHVLLTFNPPSLTGAANMPDMAPDGNGGGLDFFNVGFNAPGLAPTNAVVPEPATATMGLLGLAGLAARRRRRA